ncbi:hypothetical protein HETIRDRAFT_409601 [Heterobasidion irregulare TC 32-1]|uniref:Uncharacterized protein n=1 Tax=Heterobasidion irregulare (strain TC 32-1) TaxID=747525 RepID=W4K7P3_HETIT|nr:uncharacterized protein HETIRDRAFT_409601 [Heterobasidion irregulare TC 32-1]ETW81842.1 hypothetical protein HETIRDRAFT_409601 [Heterobasidion irregulare TC 32-1]
MGPAWSNSSWAPEVAQAIDRLCSHSEVLDIPIDTDVSTIANSRSGTVIEGRFR